MKPYLSAEVYGPGLICCAALFFLLVKTVLLHIHLSTRCLVMLSCYILPPIRTVERFSE